MPLLAAVTDLGLELKNDDLLTLSIPLRRGQYLGPVNNRFADGGLIAIGNEQHPVQLDGAALGDIHLLDINDLALGYFILLAASFNNSVDFEPPKD